MLNKSMLITLAAMCVSSICQAAVSDAGIGDYYKKEQELYQGKTAINQGEVTDNAVKPAEPSTSDNITVDVTQFLFTHSDILQEQELRNVAAKFEGKRLSIKEIYQMIDEINALYKTKKFVTAKAVLPPQRIENGIVKIQLIEGRLGVYQMEGNQHTSDHYITDRLKMKNGDLLDLGQLQNDIFHFNNTNDIVMRAELRPGEKPGTTDCVLRVQEPDEWQASLFTDNAGREESGLYRTGMVLSNNSLFGHREALVLNPTWTRGTMAGSASFTMPVDTWGTRVGVSYSKNQTNIISGPYEALDIDGESSDIGVSLTSPLFLDAKRKIDGYIEFHSKKSDTSFFGNNLLDTKTRTLTAGESFRVVSDKTIWYSQLSATGVSSTQQDNYTDKHFSRYNLSVIRQQEVSKDTSLIWRLSAQLSPDAQLPSTEQFSLGGMSSVKGFEESLVSGDQGYYLGVEYNFPLCRADNALKGLLFLDNGSAYNKYENGVRTEDHLTSAGVGLIINHSPDVFAKIVVGVPIDASREHDKTRIHFFLQSALK